jgi:aminoglycoside phosphotransferase (APT) family kinase protein
MLPVSLPVVEEASAALGRRPVSWETPPFGLSAAARYVVRFDDGTSVFVKGATDPQTAAWLRTERAALDVVGGGLGPSAVTYLERRWPVLITEDLSGAFWPAHERGVTWRPGDVDALVRTLERLGRVSARLAPVGGWPPPRWRDALSSAALVDAGLCSGAWLSRAAPDVVAADASAEFVPESLVHGDVRSDNVCFAARGVVLVDWSSAGLGNDAHDLVQLLPTLRLEGGAAPETVLRGPVGLIARLSGMTAWRAMQRLGPPWLDRVLLRLTAINLDWLASVLDLDPRDGPAFDQIE